MSSGIEIYEDQKIIRRTVSGELHTKRSLRLVREMSVAIKLNKGYNLLIDLRDTVTRPETLDLMEWFRSHRRPRKLSVAIHRKGGFGKDGVLAIIGR